jgi:hypothetical protein
MCFPFSAPVSIVACTNWQRWLEKPAQNDSPTLVTSARSLSVARP